MSGMFMPIEITTRRNGLRFQFIGNFQKFLDAVVSLLLDQGN
jgi:hypothetical protein